MMRKVLVFCVVVCGIFSCSSLGGKLEEVERVEEIIGVPSDDEKIEVTVLEMKRALQDSEAYDLTREFLNEEVVPAYNGILEEAKWLQVERILWGIGGLSIGLIFSLVF